MYLNHLVVFHTTHCPNQISQDICFFIFCNSSQSHIIENQNFQYIQRNNYIYYMYMLKYLYDNAKCPIPP